MIITDEMDDFCNKKSEEWHDGQDGCCSCHIVAPCSFCESGYGLPLAEYLELALEWEYGDDYAQSTSNPHEDYDKAMKDLF